MRRLAKSILISTILILFLTSIAAAQVETTILSILEEDGRFTTLLAAIELTETEQAFSEGYWTLFAPTDAAFGKMGLNAENIGDQLGLGGTVDLLLYQALTQSFSANQVKEHQGDVIMANGRLAGLKWFSDTIYVNDDFPASERDIFASNGVIHVMDSVITPPWPRVEEEEVEEEVAAEPEEVAATAIEEAAVVAEEAEAAVEEEAVEAIVIPANSLLGVMEADGRFSTYLAAVGALDLVQPYIEGNWTLFAPTDSAFAAHDLNADNILSELGVGQLADLLLYHALDELVTVDKAKTMLGDVTMRNDQLAGLKYFQGDLWLNDNAQVIDPDLAADNGIIHVVNDIAQRPWPYVEPPEDMTAELELPQTPQ